MQKFLLIISLLLVTACQDDIPSQTNDQTEKPKVATEKIVTTVKETPLELTTIIGFPKEIEGCSCYYSENIDDFKKDHFIFLSTYAKVDKTSNIAMLSINGERIKHSLPYLEETVTEFTIYDKAATPYIVKIEKAKSQLIASEVSDDTGIITITDKNGRQITKPFVGSCGC